MAKQRSENPKSNPGLEAYGIQVKSSSGQTILDVRKVAIPLGSCIVVMGSNGAGKSTLLKVLAGHLPAPGAKISFRNSIFSPVETRLIPGFEGMFLMPQHSDLDPHSRVQDQIRKVLRSFSEKEKESKSRSLIQLLKLKALLPQKILSLSAGERRRLGFAEVEIQKPAVLFLDEPFSDLDPENREFMLDLLFRHKQMGATMVLVSHHSEDACLLADQVWIMEKGKLAEVIHRNEEGFFPHSLDGAKVWGLKNIFLIKDWLKFGLPDLHFPEKAKAVYIPPLSVFGQGEMHFGEFGLEASWKEAFLWVSRWKNPSTGMVLMRTSEEKPVGLNAHLYFNPSEIRFLD
jgi:ABC-type multidrug transport system ATPase subunit